MWKDMIGHEKSKHILTVNQYTIYGLHVHEGLSVLDI